MDDFSSTEAQIEGLRAALRDSDQPWLGVHVLSEFIYCRRAGIIALDQRKLDDGSETELAPALGGIPTHDIDKIRYAVEQKITDLKLSVTWNAFLLAIVFALHLSFEPVWTVLMLPALFFSFRWLYHDFVILLALCARLRAARHAVKKEPNWNLPAPQAINWWNLIRAGFVSTEKVSTLEDHELKIGGKPWRVLTKGVLELPVIRIRVSDDPTDPRRQGQLRPQQLARLAAYSYLVFRCERRQAAWGIALFDKSDDGCAVPIGPEAWTALRAGLTKAREQTRCYHAHRFHDPGPPSGGTPCQRCPHGNPRKIKQPFDFGGVAVEPYITEGVDQGHYHCLCGDRFRWVPPHKQAHSLEL